MLGRLPAVKLGFVLCGEAGLDGSPYGYGGYGYGYPRGALGDPAARADWSPLTDVRSRNTF